MILPLKFVHSPSTKFKHLWYWLAETRKSPCQYKVVPSPKRVVSKSRHCAPLTFTQVSGSERRLLFSNRHLSTYRSSKVIVSGNNLVATQVNFLTCENNWCRQIKANCDYGMGSRIRNPKIRKGFFVFYF
jgi:hypothetical protein